VRELYNNALVICPLCGTRRARRGCPALDQQICAVCCGTKRLVQIRCPSDCAWLASAREHPPAAVVRQQQRDVALLLPLMRDLSERQSQLFFLLSTFIARYEPPELQPLLDDDVVESASALAATFETASRGVIYEHRPASLSGDRLMTALKTVLAEAGRGLGSAFERDAISVLRLMATAATEIRSLEPANRHAFLDLLGRVIVREPEAREQERAGSEPPTSSGLIVP
jgi:hypothetical protein